MKPTRLISLVLLPAAAVLFAHSASAQSDRNCKIVERDGPPPGASTTLSTSVQAGNGTVSAQTTGPNGITMHSGNGTVTSSTTTGSGGSQTVTTNSDGTCTIYRYKGK